MAKIETRSLDSKIIGRHENQDPAQIRTLLAQFDPKMSYILLSDLGDRPETRITQAELQSETEEIIRDLQLKEAFAKLLDSCPTVKQLLAGKWQVETNHCSAHQCGYIGKLDKRTATLNCPVDDRSAIPETFMIRMTTMPRTEVTPQVLKLWQAKHGDELLPIYRTDKLLHDTMRYRGWTEAVGIVDFYYELAEQSGMFERRFYFDKSDSLADVKQQLADFIAELQEDIEKHVSFMADWIRKNRRGYSGGQLRVVNFRQKR